MTPIFTPCWGESSHRPPGPPMRPGCDVRGGGGHLRGMRSPVKWLTTTDHKTIGTLYLVTAFAFFCVGGVMALLMRAELARPGHQIMSNEQFNQAFTMHGTIMLLMFATP
ncbi:cbb3-type cytochrome c oxidase subunit I, partial [Streptomyces angustmyceticus]